MRSRSSSSENFLHQKHQQFKIIRTETWVTDESERMLCLPPTFLVSHEAISFSCQCILPLIFEGDTLNTNVSPSLAVEPYHHILNGNLVSAAPLVETTLRFKHLGENAFAAALIVAMIQAAVALYEYRTNPEGGLVIPPGVTCGVEIPNGTEVSTDKDTQKEILPNAVEQDITITNKGILESMYLKQISRLNKWAVIFLPWAWRRVNFMMTSSTHLCHIGFIYVLVSMFGIRSPLHLNNQKTEHQADWKIDPIDSKTLKVVVIGDSLAVGLGSDNTFDTNKNNVFHIARTERLPQDAPIIVETGKHAKGPVFPRVFARTLARELQTSTIWRSAGVDGGTIEDIRRHCVGVVKEESDRGQPPDFVVILCGMNDLKKQIISSPFKSNSAGAFRQALLELIEDIRKEAPRARIIVPALPTQMFHRNSILNIFPLALFFDTVVGLWDSQKKIVADDFPDHIMYSSLSAADIYNWYNKNDDDPDEEEEEYTSLIAADGVHPNRRCYARWAETVACQLSEMIAPYGQG